MVRITSFIAHSYLQLGLFNLGYRSQNTGGPRTRPQGEENLLVWEIWIEFRRSLLPGTFNGAQWWTVTVSLGGL